MALPFSPPLRPMLAKAAKVVPPQRSPADDGHDGPAWLYEPKWDGFRCLVYRDGDEVVLGSRNERPLTRYFPELVEAVRAALPERCVLDGELVVPRAQPDGRRRLDWESLSQRIHPAASRVQLLAEQTPAELVAFDLLALGGDDLRERPLRDRRAALEALPRGHASIHVSAVTYDDAEATDWFRRFEGAGLDGVIAKSTHLTYQSDARAMVKVKHHRSGEFVVIGYRPHKSIPEAVGSMLLGLYQVDEVGEPVRGELEQWADEAGWTGWPSGLRMVGGSSAFPVAKRKELFTLLQDYRIGEANRSGAPNRWNQREDHSWVPVRPELVCEIEYDQMEGERLRHTGRFRRWRTDKAPEDCTYDQLEVPGFYDLADVLTGEAR